MSFEEELQKGLKSPEPSFRLAAIEAAIRDGNSRTILDILTAHQNVDFDEECKFLINHAIQAVSKRLLPSPQTEIGEELSLEQFGKEFQISEPAQKLKLLSIVKGKKKKEFSAYAPVLLESEKHPLVAAEILKTFGLDWPAGSLKSLILKFGSPHLSLRLAALEILVKRIPKELSASLPKLLISADPRIRGLAIRGLAAIDLTEALEHNEYLLSSEDVHDKIVGIENSFYFPFERVKAMLLRALARESEAGILKKIGSLFAINPDIEVPYRLWEMVDISSPEKSGIIKEIINDACDALEKSGRLTGEEFLSYKDNLYSWAQQRYSTRFVQDCVSRMASDVQNLTEVETLISKNIELPYVRNALAEAIKWPIKKEIRDLFQGFLDRPASISDGAGEEAGTGKNLQTEIRRIAQLQNLDRKSARQEILQIISNPDSPSSVVATAFRTAGWLEIADFVDVAENHLKGNDSVIISSVIEYLNQFGFDKLQPFLDEFVHSEDMKIKVASLRALKKENPAMALNMLRKMLASSDLTTQKSALASMVHMDFPLVRDTIADFLCSQPSEDLFFDGLCLFSANPDPQNLDVLNRVMRSLEGEYADKVREVIRQTEEFLLENGQISTRDLEEKNEQIQKDIKDEESKQGEKPAPYSLKVLVPESQERDLWRGKPSKSVNVEEKKLTRVLIGASIGIVIFLFGLNYWEIHFRVPLIDGRGLTRQPKPFSGHIIGRTSEGLLMETPDGKKIRILSGGDNDSQYNSFSQGQKFSGKLIPLRLASDGILVTTFYSRDK